MIKSGYTLIELLVVSILLVIIVSSTGMLVAATGKLVVTRRTSQSVIVQAKALMDGIKTDVETNQYTTVTVRDIHYRVDFLLLRNSTYSRVYCSTQDGSYRIIYRITNPDPAAVIGIPGDANCASGTMLSSASPTVVEPLTTKQVPISRMKFEGYYQAGLELQLTMLSLPKWEDVNSTVLSSGRELNFSQLIFNTYVSR